MTARSPVRALPYGEDGVLLEVADAAHVVALQRAAAALPGAREVVPGARTVLVVFDPAVTTGDAVTAALARAAAHPAASGPGGDVRITVTYDGPDLAAVAGETGLSVDEVVARHAGGTYTVAFCGFSPGFAYLTGLDPVLHVPRLAEPRAAVPAGSVAVAGEFAGVYPRVSPGGWRLLGRTDATLWDTARPAPALLVPGTTVRFVPA